MIKITTETTHDQANVHLHRDDIEIGSMCLINLGTVSLHLGDLTVFLSIEQAQTLHRKLNESLADALLDSVVLKEGG